MIGRLRNILGLPAAEKAGSGKPAVDERHLAAAALLVEVAAVDTNFDEAERARIIYGAQTSIIVGFGVVVVSLCVHCRIGSNVAETTHLFSTHKLAKPRAFPGGISTRDPRHARGADNL